MDKYTKGEWRIHKPANCDYTIHTGVWGEGITQVAIIIESYPNAEANAQLIASAPKLYEALKFLASQVSVMGYFKPEKQGEIRQALDKAKGK